MTGTSERTATTRPSPANTNGRQLEHFLHAHARKPPSLSLLGIWWVHFVHSEPASEITSGSEKVTLHQLLVMASGNLLNLQQLINAFISYKCCVHSSRLRNLTWRLCLDEELASTIANGNTPANQSSRTIKVPYYIGREGGEKYIRTQRFS